MGNPPRITSRGLDLIKYPIDSVLRQALSEDEEEFRRAVGFLPIMHLEGRREAGVFLLGLFAHSGENWRRRTEVVERLDGFDTQECADLLLDDIGRVKGSNTTRQYLTAVLKVVEGMPAEMTRRRLLDMIYDYALSPRMRGKLVRVPDRANR